MLTFCKPELWRSLAPGYRTTSCGKLSVRAVFSVSYRREVLRPNLGDNSHLNGETIAIRISIRQKREKKVEKMITDIKIVPSPIAEWYIIRERNCTGNGATEVGVPPLFHTAFNPLPQLPRLGTLFLAESFWAWASRSHIPTHTLRACPRS